MACASACAPAGAGDRCCCCTDTRRRARCGTRWRRRWPATEAFARAYWHWFFLIQPAPLPERLIEADPRAYLHDLMGRRSGAMAPFDPRALAEYERAIALPGTAHGLCEDYRASAGIDLAHDRADRDRGVRLATPLLVLWGRDGVVHRCFEPLKEWRRIADCVEGAALPCGHYVAEEAPDALLAAALPFFGDEDTAA
jgi:haloacetate dehalogenase